MSAVCSSCGAHIVWATTEHGRLMPVDAAPSAEGNLRLTWVPSRKVYIVAARVKGGEKPLYTSHFATCPNASKHRRGKS